MKETTLWRLERTVPTISPEGLLADRIHQPLTTKGDSTLFLGQDAGGDQNPMLTKSDSNSMSIPRKNKTQNPPLSVFYSLLCSF